jgi:hypothetical protein
MKRFTMIVVLSMFFLIGNHAESVWADELNEHLSSDSVPKRMGEEGFVFGNGIFDVDFGLQFGSINGDTTYRISFDGGESELEFPLGAYLFGVNFGWGYRNERKQEIARMELKWLTNVSNGNGVMKDSDWIDDDASFLEIPGYSHPGLDIYSESDIKLKAHIFNISAVYNYWPGKNFSIGPMVGYRYQSFKYDVKDTIQVGYGAYATDYSATVGGKTLEYEVSYHIPYFGLSSNLLLGKRFKTNLSFGYSPFAFANDKDDHLLRYKLSEGDTDGYAYIANMNVNWNLLTHLYFSIGGEYMKIHTTGTQDQSFYAGEYSGWTAEVDDKITSSHWSIYEMITYRF